MKSSVRQIESALREHATPGRAEKEKAYLKSELRHLGVPMPAIRKVAKRFAKGLEREATLALADALWAEPVHELRVCAVEVLSARKKTLTLEDLPRLERMIREAKTWAMVDPLAIDLVGGLVAAHPERTTARLDRWIADDDFWIRRSAMLALLRPLRRGEGDWDRFVRYADATLHEKEFFVRKAIGWVLREAGKKQPDRVRAFVEPRVDRISGVSIREAVKPLDEQDRERLMAAYRAR